MRPPRGSTAAAAAVALAVFAAGERASSGGDAPTKEACVAAYKDAQRLRKAGKLKAAREQLVTCSQKECPGVVVADCSPWLAQVEEALPSISIEARGADGRDLVAVRVLADGAELAPRLDGVALTIDPGPHHLVFEHEGAVVEQDVVIREGERRRKIAVTFPRVTPPPPVVPVAPLPPPVSVAPLRTAEPPAPIAPASRPTPISVYVLGAAGAASVAASLALGIATKIQVADMREDCAPHCVPSDVDAGRARLITADVLLGTGLVALGVGAILWLTRPSVPPKKAAGVTVPRVAAPFLVRPALVLEF